MKAVFFDFDGVLTTDKTGSLSVRKYVSNKSKIDIDNFYRQYSDKLLYGQLTHRDVWGDICKSLNVAIPYNILFESFIFTPVDNEIVKLVKQIKTSC